MTGINDKARNGTSCVSLTPISVANSYNRGGGYNEGSMIGEHFLRHFSFFSIDQHNFTQQILVFYTLSC